MTAPARMSPEREAELRAEHRLSRDERNGMVWCFGCGDDVPPPSSRCQVVEVLDALAAEREAAAEQGKCTALAQKDLQEQIERAQQGEVPHSSAAVLGYTCAQESGYDSSVGWEVIDEHQEVVQLGTFEQSDDAGLHNCFRVAVVRVGADGRVVL